MCPCILNGDTALWTEEALSHSHREGPAGDPLFSKSELRLLMGNFNFPSSFHSRNRAPALGKDFINLMTLSFTMAKSFKPMSHNRGRETDRHTHTHTMG